MPQKTELLYCPIFEDWFLDLHEIYVKACENNTKIKENFEKQTINTYNAFEKEVDQ